MSDATKEEKESPQPEVAAAEKGGVISHLPNGYFLQLGTPEEEMDFLDLWYAVTSRKLMIFLVVLGFTLLGVFLALVLPRQYLGTVTVAIVSSQNSSSAATSSSANSAVPPSVTLNQEFTADEITGLIQGREFIYRFIEDNKLLPVLFEKDWNKDAEKWEPTLMHRWLYGDTISIWDGYTKFSDILDVETDSETNLTTVSVKWTDAKLATEWANKMVQTLNAQMRELAIRESEAILAELNAQLQKTSAVELRQALYNLMETQMAKIVSARVHPEFAMKVLDKAVVPEDQAIPYLQLILIAVSLFLGLIVALSLVLLLHTIAKSKAKNPGRVPPNKRARRRERKAAA